MKKVQEPFKRFAHFYDFFMIVTGLYKTKHILKLAPLKANQRILDIGGGTGYLARKLLGEQREIHVIDTSPDMIRYLDDSPVITTIGDGKSTPYKDNYFHGIILSDAYHHIEQQDALLEEIDRILSPDGFLLIYEFNKSSLLATMIGWLEEKFISPVFYVTPQKLKEKVSQRNYILQKEINKGYWFIHLYQKTNLLMIK